VTPEDIARRFDNRVGYRLVAYGPVGLPVYRLTAIALCIVKKALSPIEEFVLRGIGSRVDTVEDLAGFLGLHVSVVEPCIAEFVRTECVRTIPSAGANSGYRLTSKGESTVREQESTVPMEQTIAFCVDGLTRRPRFYHTAVLSKPRDLREQGVPEIRSYPPRPPALNEIDVNDVISVVRIDAGAKESPRQLLCLNSIERRDRLFIEAIALAYRADTSGELQIGFSIDGRLSAEHEQAFSIAEGFDATRLLHGLQERIVVPSLIDLIGDDLSAQLAPIAAMRTAEAEALNRSAREERARLGAARQQAAEQQEGAEQVVAQSSAKVAEAERKLSVLPVRPLAVYEYVPLVRDAVTKSKRRLLIVSPWSRKSVADGSFVMALQKALDRGVRIHIGYSATEVGGRENDWDIQSRKDLEELLRKNRGKMSLRQLEDNYPTILIKDNEHFVVSSFDWLSLGGGLESAFREHWGTLVGVPEIVDEFYRRMASRFSDDESRDVV
jgi:hypothetical protein